MSMPMKWKIGPLLGRGSFGSVNYVVTESRTLPAMAVKSAALAKSESLLHEKMVLSNLQGCKQIVSYFGYDLTIEEGEKTFNVFLEYVCGGTLADRIKRSNCGMFESDVRKCTKSILKGLMHIHEKGYVHCDMKPQNILMCSTSSNNVKIADFGLAKQAGRKTKEGSGLRGTPYYMSPESIALNEHERSSDIWCLGCIVLEMLTGEKPWRSPKDGEVNALLIRIAFSGDVPEIPSVFQEDAEDFLSRCLARNPANRWTAERLLEHPFLEEREELTQLFDLHHLWYFSYMPNLLDYSSKRQRLSVGKCHSNFTTNEYPDFIPLALH